MSRGGSITEVADALRAHYAIDAAALHEVAGGHDARARVYRASAQAPVAHYLVKTRAADGRDVGPTVASYLHDAGVPHVLAPVRTTAGRVSARHGDLALTVYPFVDGRMGAEGGLSRDAWRAFGTLVRRLHSAPLPPALSALLERDRYRPRELETIRDLEAVVLAGDFADGLAADVGAFWSKHAGEIEALASRTQELGSRLAEPGLPHVLCHADLHTWNVIVADDGELWLVDWDEVVLAPKERDLMFVVGGIGAGLVSPEQTACFFDGYGEVDVDPLALSYYRHAWAVQDIASWAERVLVAPALSAEERSEAARIFVGLFESGEIVALAAGST